MMTIKQLFRSGQQFGLFTSLVLLLMVWGCQTANATDIRVSIDRNPVNVNESFQLIFTAAQSPDDDPDFGPLEKDFSILNQNNSTSSSWVNGKSSKTVQWVLSVMAKRVGSLIIPPIKFGKDVSQASSILVADQAAKNGLDTHEDLFIDVEATPQNPYIQSQVFYTLKLYTKVNISQARLNEPELSDAVIERLGEDSNYNTQIDGVDYSVTERKYAFFPQKSGKLTIKPLVLTAEVLVNNAQGFNPFFNSQMSKTKRVESKAITLDVKPVPAEFKSQHWLSAEQVIFKQEWSGDIAQLKVGEPITRTLSLVAKGTTVGQLPELNTTETNAQIKAYPDQPVLQEQKKVEGLYAFREEKIALIPSKAGSYKLPAIEIPWFNTQTQKMEIAKVPEVTLSSVSTATQAEPEVKPTPIPNTPTASVETPKTDSATLGENYQQTKVWLWVSVFLAVGWLTTIVVFLRKRKTAKVVVVEDEAEISLKAAIKNLKQACAENDAIAAKEALLIWGKQKFEVNNLGSIAGFCEARLRDEILLLNQTLYGKESSQWQGKKLFQAFTENKARGAIKEAVDKSLEPLYKL
ncbi:MAG: BatD family protein [Methylococcales bacterium]|nr:BatD family protein [Methylococcales bacterium]